MFIKSYNNFLLEYSSNSEYSIPAESDILKWTKEAEGGDIDSFAKLLDVVKKGQPKNFKEVRKVNLASKGWRENRTLFD